VARVDAVTAAPRLGAVPFAIHDAGRPLLVLGPSLGTSVTALWRDVVPLLTDRVDVWGWDLPGHGTAPEPDPAALDGLSIADLAAAVLEQVALAQAVRGDAGAPFHYAGVSVGGAVGQRLLVDAAGRVTSAVLICTAARFGEPQPWLDRADLVARAGTPTQVTGSAQRWFAPGFIQAHPDVATRLLAALQTTDRFGYAAVCRAVAAFDLTDRLGAVAAPVVAVAGADDQATPPADLARIAEAIPGARLEVLGGVGHLAPAEAPDAIARIVGELVAGKVTTR
jgi:3-oxoadipate enol-lactonase